VTVHLHPKTLEVVDASLRRATAPKGFFDPERLGAMITLLRSLTDSMPELPVVDAVPEWVIGPDVGGS
jgi:hypothetical protein